jgi:DNA-binding transcriptional LysR family regulator
MGRPESPYDLPKHSLLVIGETAPLTTWRLINESGATAQVIARPVLISNESATIMRQAVSGAGIALISRQLMAHRLAEGVLEIVLPEWHRSNDVEISALFPKKATLDRKVRAFVDFAAEVFSSWMVEKHTSAMPEVAQSDPPL